MSHDLQRARRCYDTQLSEHFDDAHRIKKRQVVGAPSHFTLDNAALTGLEGGSTHKL